MIKSKRDISLVIALVVIMISMVSCGSKKEKVTTGRVPIRFENWEMTPQQLKLWREVVDKFNRTHPEIEVKFQPVQGGPQKILIEMAGGNAPDIFFWSAPELLAPLVAKGTVVNLTPYIKDSKVDLSKYFANTLSSAKFGKGIYGFPPYWGTTAIAYNKDLFDKAGVNYPDANWTWQDFLEIAKKLTVVKKGRIIQYGAIPPRFLRVIISFGGNIFDERGNCLLDSPEVKEAFRFLQDLRYKYKVAPSMAALPPDFYRGEIEMFQTGRVAMFAAESWVLSTLKDIKNFRWDVAPIPRRKGLKRRILSGSAVLVISSQSKHPKEAWEFIRFACSKEGEDILAQGRNAIPSLKTVVKTVFDQPPPDNISVFVKQIEEIVPRPKFSWYREWQGTIFHEEYNKLMLNKQTPQETINNIIKRTENFQQRLKNN